MTADNEPTLTEPPANGTEIEALLGSLERQRATFYWKASGLNADQLQVTVGASTMTLGGLLKHLSIVEDDYFAWRLLGEDPGFPLNSVDFEADPDWEWRTAADDSPTELYAMWNAAVARSRSCVTKALANGGMDQAARNQMGDGRTRNMRRIFADIIEEYARHTGHADLIRESIDGLVGEDPQSQPPA